MPNDKLRILAVGAHPDDIEFGCGGVLLVEAARGSEIALAVCSRGESGTNGTPEERETEARKAAEMLGATLEFLELGGDCRLEVSTANHLVIARQIRKVRPDVVLAPTASARQHLDHLVISQLVKNAARLARYGGLKDLDDLAAHAIRQHFEYAITPSAEPRNERAKICVDLGECFQRWLELMECHQTQLRTRRYVELQVARARVLGLEAGVEYAQALWPLDDFFVQHLGDMPKSVRHF